jgi:hypothetical protein
MKHIFLVAHWHIVDVKAEKCSTIANLKKIYFQCKKHMHKVSYPRVATTYELFNKMLVYNNLKLHTWIYQLTPVFLPKTLFRTWLSSHNFWSSSSRCTEFALNSNVVFGRSTVCLYFPSCFSPSKSKQAKLNSTTLFLTIKPGLIARAEIKLSNINRLLHFFIKKNKPDQNYGYNQAMFYPIHRDGNGYPRPDTRWVFTPLGYVCGLNILPVGLLLGKNLHPMGKRVLERSAFTHTR